MKVLKSSRNGDIPFVRREMNSYLFHFLFFVGDGGPPLFTFTLLHFYTFSSCTSPTFLFHTSLTTGLFMVTLPMSRQCDSNVYF